MIDISNCLDSRRLNKQKIEIFQILNCLCIGKYQHRETIIHEWKPCDNETYNNSPKINVRKTPWYNHPATQAVKNYELFFIDYALEIADSCLRLGYKDTLIPKIKAFKEIFSGEYKKPWYWGNEKFHSSHRAALLFKNFEYYSKFGWGEIPIMNYWWPSKHLDNLPKLT